MGGARGVRTRPPPTAGLRRLVRQTLGQTGQLLLPLTDEVVDSPLADQQRRRGGDEAPVVLELRLGEVAGQDAVDRQLPADQGLLQLPGVFGLSEKERALVKEGLLKGRSQHVVYTVLFITETQREKSL